MCFHMCCLREDPIFVRRGYAGVCAMAAAAEPLAGARGGDAVSDDNVAAAISSAVAEGSLGADPLGNKILELKEQARRLRVERQQAAKDLKAARRKASRMKKKARQLSDEDLVGVLMMRKAARHALAAQTRNSAGASSGTPSSERAGPSDTGATRPADMD